MAREEQVLDAACGLNQVGLILEKPSMILPSSLISELKQRRAVLFAGAGLSADLESTELVGPDRQDGKRSRI